MSAWQLVIIEPIKVMLIKVGNFVGALIGVLLILIIGWLIAKVVQNIVVRFLKAVNLDSISEQLNIDKFLAKGGIKYTLSELLGVLCYWLTVLIVLVVAINAVGLTVAADLLNKIVLYVPNVIVSIFILILGMFVSIFLSTIVQTTATNAGIEYARLLGKVVQVAVVIFAIAIALEQLNIGSTIIALAVNIILASLGLGLALAFGLGCKDIAGKTVSDFVEKLKRK